MSPTHFVGLWIFYRADRLYALSMEHGYVDFKTHRPMEDAGCLDFTCSGMLADREDPLHCAMRMADQTLGRALEHFELDNMRPLISSPATPLSNNRATSVFGLCMPTWEWIDRKVRLPASSGRLRPIAQEEVPHIWSQADVEPQALNHGNMIMKSYAKGAMNIGFNSFR